MQGRSKVIYLSSPLWCKRGAKKLTQETWTR